MNTTVPGNMRFKDMDDLKAWLQAQGYVVIKAKSYRAAQERQRIAECMTEMAKDDAKHARAWAINCLDEERRLRDRLTFVYGVAKACGAIDDDMRGDLPGGAA